LVKTGALGITEIFGLVVDTAGSGGFVPAKVIKIKFPVVKIIPKVANIVVGVMEILKGVLLLVQVAPHEIGHPSDKARCRTIILTTSSSSSIALDRRLCFRGFSSIMVVVIKRKALILLTSELGKVMANA
jgi:hypothetical protein